MVYVHVRLRSQGRDALAQFERAIRDRPEVLDCCTLTGEWDFYLRIVTHDMKEYEAFFLDHLSKIPNVQSVNSSIVVTVIKESTVLPLATGVTASTAAAAILGAAGDLGLVRELLDHA